MKLQNLGGILFLVAWGGYLALAFLSDASWQIHVAYLCGGFAAIGLMVTQK